MFKNEITLRVPPIHLLNVEQHQVAANPQTMPSNQLGLQLHLQAAIVYSHITRHKADTDQCDFRCIHNHT